MRVDVSKDGLDPNSLKSYGSVVDTGGSVLRVFTFESAARELSELAIQRNVSFTVSPITLDDVFVHLVGGTIDKGDINGNEQNERN
jgi:ABC-2 type transport system ATP-binding protein